MATKVQRKPKPATDPQFNLTIDEVKMIGLYRQLCPIDRQGVVGALIKLNQEPGADELSHDSPGSADPVG